MTAQNRQCNNDDVGCFKDALQDIVGLKAKLDSYKYPSSPSVYSNDSRSISLGTPACHYMVFSPTQHQYHQQSSLNNQSITATATVAPISSLAPVCLCGVTDVHEENARLRRGLVAKHNEVVRLRGLMTNKQNVGNNNGPERNQYQGAAHSAFWNGAVLPFFRGTEVGLPAGGETSTTTADNEADITENGSHMSAAIPFCLVNSQIGYGAPGTYGAPCRMPGCPYGSPQGWQNMTGGLYNTNALAHCDTDASTSVIIEESKRQMEETEYEIKYKLQKIKGKKDELEEDIANLENLLLAKEQEATTNMQAARVAKACQIAQDAQVAIELQQQQKAQAQEAARAAMELQKAQDEQSRKQALAAEAANMAQQAQYHQLMMVAQAVEAAERAEIAQKQQAAQAEEAAKAAESVKVAQEEQHRLATKQLQDAEQLKRNQDEQACKTAQATEALHAAHVAQVAQHMQGHTATTQAHSMLTEYNFAPTTMDSEEIERSVGCGAISKCCNPNCPNNK